MLHFNVYGKYLEVSILGTDFIFVVKILVSLAGDAHTSRTADAAVLLPPPPIQVYNHSFDRVPTHKRQVPNVLVFINHQNNAKRVLLEDPTTLNKFTRDLVTIMY